MSHTVSFYHSCRSVLDRMQTISGLDQYMKEYTDSEDPLEKLQYICRQGSSLCLLFNLLRPAAAIKLNRNFSLVSVNNLKVYVYDFLIACRQHLHLSEDDLFTITDLYQEDTSGFVKVVDTVNKLLDLLEEEGIITSKGPFSQPPTPAPPKDTRDKVVFELLETERKYVQHLQTLQHYMRELQRQKILSLDTSQRIFGNLNSLIDFQLRFLIRLESHAERPPQQQRIGNLFLQSEHAFSVYEPFCANIQRAQELVLQHTPRLQLLSQPIQPSELPSMLIKPVQRVCKYPLLMQQLIKSTPTDWDYYEETEEGLKAIQRVASKVNEAQRLQENKEILKGLTVRIKDPKGLSFESFGPLLLIDKFVVSRADTEKEMLVFLFEKSMLICKERKKDTKQTTKKRHEEGDLSVRGIILTSRIVQVNKTTSDGQWSLRVFWSQKVNASSSLLQSFNLQSFTLKCRHSEQQEQWEECLNRLVEMEKRLSREHKRETRAARHASEDQYTHAQSPCTATNPTKDDDMAMLLPFSPVSSRFPSSSSASTLSSNSDQYLRSDEEETGMLYSSSSIHLKRAVSTEEISLHSEGDTYTRARSWSSTDVHSPSLDTLYGRAPAINSRTVYKPKPDTRYQEDIRVTLHYRSKTFRISVPEKVDYEELLHRIEGCIPLRGCDINSRLGLKYEDEEGDLITITSNEDLRIGWENQANNNDVAFYVTC
ncbi:hypothetical protein EC973_005300 [Apophysomyces ossiformis]|uniref:Uncharacterized protein n=1 Tax=Apophysomyces ossiformis TaxID=679940 RepID=A0A8H7BRR9_9FUNG|nr:hypothetical protein EC973_005300 [Apophysomyces ossiformis]